MKQIIHLIFYLVLAFFLTACNQNDISEDDLNDEESSVSENEEVQEEEPSELEESDDVENEEAEEDETKENNTENEEIEKSEPKYYISEETATVLPIDDKTNENVVLLTIDDVPDKHALEMAKTLKELDAGAIFFVNGHFIDTPEEQERLKEIYDMGFVIGNHTYNHTNLVSIEQDEQQQFDEIVPLNDKIEEIIGERPKFFRAPNGSNTDYSDQLVKDEGMIRMNWTYGYDYFSGYMNMENVDDLTEAMVTGEGPKADVPYSLLKPGANLLMHDREWTAAALADIVIGLREAGYEIVNPHEIKTNQE